ncbi:acyltransferase [Alicyclobacillus vulcanalis]|uniref:Surface polysaccharide O-acyltransferase, integral membrane enzyme n=1 Tax=Alicyclobacillus vulcanalis TaxID=252246 RepID=A0A1N7JVY2_9BACL|nr:acyltransferase [Alicyclobacillus vulcanalis]SIS53364.1 Surface polysaccharide O-acyltransferase, integral membrane enzyme [Alicyclobacillus vulcanalis]
MGKRYLDEIDLMRAFVILGVLTVHTLSFFNVLNSDGTPQFYVLGALITATHFTRETFMFVTGLVLFTTYVHQDPFRPGPFWRKRFQLIAIPYVVWTLAYIAFVALLTPGFSWTWSTLFPIVVHNLLTGNMFFLYFLVVSMQLYLVFPLLLSGIRRAARYHVHILVASFALEICLMWLNQNVLDSLTLNSHWPKWLYDLYTYRDRNLLMYQFWFVAGAVLACHYDRVAEWMVRHRKALFITLGAALFVLWGHYALERLFLHDSEDDAELVLQPIMVPYSLIVTCAFWYAGLAWSKRRERPGWRLFSRFVRVASQTSFGIYLLQPFPLYAMEIVIDHLDAQGIPSWLHYALLPLAILFTYFSSMLVAYVLMKIPFVSYAVGRRATVGRRARETVRQAA